MKCPAPILLLLGLFGWGSLNWPSVLINVDSGRSNIWMQVVEFHNHAHMGFKITNRRCTSLNEHKHTLYIWSSNVRSNRTHQDTQVGSTLVDKDTGKAFAKRACWGRRPKIRGRAYYLFVEVSLGERSETVRRKNKKFCVPQAFRLLMTLTN